MTKQLIKYIGNKTKFAKEIVSNFPCEYDLYIEPFFGSGAVLGQLKPKKSIAIDNHKPLIEMWKLAKNEPKQLSDHYRKLWNKYSKSKLLKKEVYKNVVESYNNKPNPLDFLFISRTCYGGILRYRKADGHLSTPLGPHLAIKPSSFDRRLEEWNYIIQNTKFIHGDFSCIDKFITKKTLIYCDPPYIDTQKIIYGAQNFKFDSLCIDIAKWKKKNAFVALSIDGSKFSGKKEINLKIEKDLFEKNISINLGGSMLKRFQLKSGTTKNFKVTDRLLVTQSIKKKEQLSFID